jgi:hypothetical protein
MVSLDGVMRLNENNANRGDINRANIPAGLAKIEW